MINLKLIVQLVITFVTCVSCSEYCEICPNHTLCVYGVGPSTNCREYDSSVQLSRDDIVTLLMRINERRNFVALGKSNNMPQAANMKKINWSEDLATFAQRWVDQCDPFVRPDRHDQCRDLKNVKVSQSIVTVFGSAPGLSIKSYVDIWYMQRLQYTGNIYLYDEFVNRKTNHFTQLIWAETDSVGCGKARFYLTTQNASVERLVCNFAPAGNIHKKPVYTLGIPATQCKNQSIADIEYTGLCIPKLRVNENEKKLTPKRPPRTSLLRILNLLNNSIKQDIDPIKSDSKLTNTKPEVGERNQKIRHVFNNSLENRSPYKAPTPEYWNTPNDTKILNQHSHDRGHAKVYHGHNFMGYVPALLTTKKIIQLESIMTKQSFSKFRRVNQGKACTRTASTSGCDVRLPCVTNRCTRGLRSDCRNTPPCFSSPSEYLFSRSLCPCSSQSPNKYTNCNNCCNLLKCTAAPFPYACTNMVHINIPSSCCPKFTRPDDIIHSGSNGERNNREPHYYDLFPNVAVRSGEDLYDPSNEEKVSKKLLILNEMATQKPKFFSESENENNDRTVKNDFIYRKHSMDSSYIYDVFDSIDRIKRDTDKEENLFWQLNAHSSTVPLQLRTLRYTTLSNKNTGRFTSKLSNTQSFESDEYYNRNHENKERYLSFDELMSLRKNNMGDNFRRYNKKQKTSTKMAPRAATQATTTAATTTKATITPPANYTINTPFLRKKYCTRKLTCTWTAFTITGSDGKVIDGGGGVPQGIPGQGSKTPSGYVEGCTRTSTCTRDYMNRNKISTTPKTTLEAETVPDEDYCERRSLEVRPEPDDETELNEKVKRHISQIDSVSDETLTLHNEKESEANTKRKFDFDLTYSIHKKNPKCRKRRELNMLSYPDFHKKIDFINPGMSYGDMYFLVLTKLIKSLNSTDHSQNHKMNKCLCNNSFKTYKYKGISKVAILVIINKLLTLL